MSITNPQNNQPTDATSNNPLTPSQTDPTARQLATKNSLRHQPTVQSVAQHTKTSTSYFIVRFNHLA
jgi:AraC-like DNA-binding protein